MSAACGTRLLLAMLLTVGSLAVARQGSGGLSSEPAAAAGSTEAAQSAPGAAAPATLEWKATKEEGVYGYLVYRSPNRGGPFERLGHEIVHVSQEPGKIHSYRFVDATVVAGQTYYYYLDKISTTGVKSRFSGVVAKQVLLVATTPSTGP